MPRRLRRVVVAPLLQVGLDANVRHGLHCRRATRRNRSRLSALRARGAKRSGATRSRGRGGARRSSRSSSSRVDALPGSRAIAVGRGDAGRDPRRRSEDLLDRLAVEAVRREPEKAQERGRKLHDLASRRHVAGSDAGSGRGEDPGQAVVARVAVEDSTGRAYRGRSKRLGHGASGRVDVDALVARQDDELRRLVEVRAAVELLLAPDVERRLAASPGARIDASSSASRSA